ncbi:hypothetical protein SAMN05421540_1154 [Psychroflexus halocasei]|uniref:Uncharacterized protein n=1 Tax=Psychroflexus halocasei TaxID=908615 RepID=A0A1H4DT40_9FLAO|nr:hypothetical protein SAMN05421540_1154 [Psychroflexus halocasei]
MLNIEELYFDTIFNCNQTIEMNKIINIIKLLNVDLRT